MKKKNHLLLFSIALFGIILFMGCEEDLPYRYESLVLPDEPLDYMTVDAPNHLKSNLENKLLQQGVTNEGATLGRVLFYDKTLSLNNKVACASCHHQENGFADPVAFSTGFENQKTTRNAMTIVNTMNQQTFFWDSRENDLVQMSLKPIENHIEMGMESLEDLETKLRTIPYYAELFEAAYGSSTVKKERIADALAMFMRSMISANSRFDKGAADNYQNLTAIEKGGMELFNGKAQCVSCHGGSDLRGSWGDDWANIGLDMEYEDPGLGENNIHSVGMFKIPSLRNIELTAPYMHDGRFATLEDVVNHYSEGVQSHPNLDWRLGGGQFGGGGGGFFPTGGTQHLNLSASEKTALIAFLKTLTDDAFIADDRFSDPFGK